MKVCTGGEPITKRNYETMAQFQRREAKGLCSSACLKKHGKPARAEFHHSSLELTQPPRYTVEDKEPQPKDVPWRSKPYRDFIKLLPCIVPGCGRPADDPHHEQEKAKGGMGTTPGDDRCVPMCREHHDIRQHGPLGRKIWARWGIINIERVILALNEEYQRRGHAIKEER